MAGVIAINELIHSTPTSTKHRLRAIRPSGSPASMERTTSVKYRFIGCSATHRNQAHNRTLVC